MLEDIDEGSGETPAGGGNDAAPKDAGPQGADLEAAELGGEAFTQSQSWPPAEPPVIRGGFIVLPHKKALLVDFDGTTAHTFQAHVEPYRRVLSAKLAEADKSLPKDFLIDKERWMEIYFSATGGSELGTCANFIEKVEEAYGVQLNYSAKELRKERNEFVAEHVGELGIEINEELVSKLGAAKAKGCKLILCTASSSGFVTPILKHFGLSELFDGMVTAEQFKPEQTKPAPDQYLAALALTGEHARNAVAFEDNLKGATAAVLAGVDVAVCPPEHLRESFEQQLKERKYWDSAKRFVAAHEFANKANMYALDAWKFLSFDNKSHFDCAGESLGGLKDSDN